MRTLEDEVHAIVVNQFLNWSGLKGLGDAQIHVEVPYSYYGHSGRIDVVVYESLHDEECPPEVSIYEIQTRILNLNQVLGKFNEKVEFFPKYLTSESKLRRPPHFVGGALVLLNTMPNVKLVEDNLQVFKAAFAHPYDRAVRRGLLEMKQL